MIRGVGGDGDRVRIWGVGLGKILVRYPVRYVQKTAISEQLLLGDDEAGNIRLNCQNSRTWRWQMITLSVAEFLRRWVAVAGVAGGLPGSVSPATTATRWVSLPIRENSCHSWFHLKACGFREGWKIFNHE